jgi:hypothetical protein
MYVIDRVLNGKEFTEILDNYFYIPKWPTVEVPPHSTL